MNRITLPICHLPLVGLHRLLLVSAIVWLTLVAQAGANSLALLDGEVRFNKGEFLLTAEGRHSLDSLTRTLRSFHGILSIRIIGHTNDSGNATADKVLSQRRADQLAKHFKNYFPNAHILSLGAGDSMPIASHLNDEGRRLNRRVQIQAIASGHASGNH